MQPKFLRSLRFIEILVVVMLGLAAVAGAADFTVLTPGGQFSFQINGTSGNPTVTLQRGSTYTFAVNASSFHPFAIGTTVFGATPSGVTGNNTFSGTVTFAVPTNAPNCVYYCGQHGFSGSILMIDPPVPPPFQIVGLNVSDNLTLRYTGTNTFTYTPEFSTNLGTTNWFTLTVQSTTSLLGTNEAVCGRPAGSNVFLRIRAR